MPHNRRRRVNVNDGSHDARGRHFEYAVQPRSRWQQRREQSHARCRRAPSRGQGLADDSTEHRHRGGSQPLSTPAVPHPTRDGR